MTGGRGVHLADRLRVLPGRALVLDGRGVALHRRDGSLLGACEVGLRSIELLLGDVEIAAKAAALTAGSVVQLVSHCDLSSPRVGDAGFGVLQRISIGSGCGRHVGGDAVGVGERGVRLGLALSALRLTCSRHRGGCGGRCPAPTRTTRGSRTAASVVLRRSTPRAGWRRRGCGVGWWPGRRLGRRR